jgi:diketogulonate reductase-like aldo/keto reductase
MADQTHDVPTETVQSIEIPKLGLGTWQSKDDTCREAVRHALELGYRHIDTAQAYENEEQVGAGIADSDVDRDDIFLTTKIWYTQADADSVKRSTEESLRKLDTDYVDLLLLHWPNDDVPLEETLEAMMELKDEDKTRLIGVSNFPSDMLRRALELAPIATNQVEYHPYLNQDHILVHARDNGFVLTSYSPLGRGRVVDDEQLAEIGEKYGKSAAQVALRWQLQQDAVVAIPKANSAEHREDNFDIFDFELTTHEMDAIHPTTNDKDRIIDPSFAPEWAA